MANGINIKLDADTAGLSAGTEEAAKNLDRIKTALDGIETASDASSKDTVKSLDKVGDAAEDSARRAGKAADKIERDTKDALTDIPPTAEKAYDKVGDAARQAGDKAGDSLTDLGKKAGETGRELGDAMSGGLEGMGDLATQKIGDIAGMFGPLGLAVGAVAGFAVNQLTNALGESEEAAAATKEEIIALADELAEVDGNPGAIDWAKKLRKELNEIYDVKHWWEVWQTAPVTVLEHISELSKKAGIELGKATQGMSGDANLAAASLKNLDQIIEKNTESFTQFGSTGGTVKTRLNETGQAAQELKDTLAEHVKKLDEAAKHQEIMTQALGGLKTGIAESVGAVEEFNSAIGKELTDAGAAWDKYTNDGVVNLAEYNAAIENQAAAMEKYQQNLVTASEKMSAEALNYVRSLGPQSAPLLQAFLDAPLEEQERAKNNWDHLGHVSTDGFKSSLEIDKVVRDSAKEANAAATNNPVNFAWQFDTSGLQQQVDRAARGASAVITFRARLGEPTL